MKEWKGVIEKIKGLNTILQGKKGKTREGSVIRTSCSDKKLTVLFSMDMLFHTKNKGS